MPATDPWRPPSPVDPVPPQQIREAMLPLRLIFWGALLVILDLTVSQTMHGRGWRFDILNDLVGMLMITWAVFRLAAFVVGSAYRGVMTFVQIAAVLACVEVLHAHFIYDPHPLVQVWSEVVDLASLIATLLFCLAMRWLSTAAGLERSARSWLVTLWLFALICLLPLGILSLAAITAIANSRSVDVPLDPILILPVMAVFLLPLIHFFISTSRMRREIDSRQS